MTMINLRDFEDTNMTKHTKSTVVRENLLRQSARMLTNPASSMTDRQQLAALIECELENNPPAEEQPEDRYPPCDYCAAEVDYMPWHGSGMINGVESRHIHACNNCRNLLPCREQPKTFNPVVADALLSRAWGLRLDASFKRETTEL